MPHPCDWFTTGGERTRDYKRLDDIYQPWIDELAELGIRPEGLLRYHPGVTLTKENWHLHGAPQKSFKVMLGRDRRGALELLDALDSLEWEGTKRSVIICLGDHPMDTPWLERLARKGTPKVRDTAAEVLEEMADELTEEQVAAKVATHFEARDGTLTETEIYDLDRVLRLLGKTHLEAVARKLGLTPADFADRVSSEKRDFWVFSQFIGETGNEETRSIFARRMLEHGTPGAPSLYRDMSPELWELAAERSFSVQYWSSIFDFFCFGALSYRKISEKFDLGILRRLESKPPRTVYVIHDFLLLFGLIADKDAAQRILGEAKDSGLDPADPRLTVLRLNLAL